MPIIAGVIPIASYAQIDADLQPLRRVHPAEARDGDGRARGRRRGRVRARRRLCRPAVRGAARPPARRGSTSTPSTAPRRRAPCSPRCGRRGRGSAPASSPRSPSLTCRTRLSARWASSATRATGSPTTSTGRRAGARPDPRPADEPPHVRPPRRRRWPPRGNRVIAVDLLGHGRSDRPERPAALLDAAFADQVAALIDHLELETAVVGGTSLGANVALELATHHPKRGRGRCSSRCRCSTTRCSRSAGSSPRDARAALRQAGARGLVAASPAVPRTHQLVDIVLDWVRQRPGALAGRPRGPAVRADRAATARSARRIDQPALSSAIPPTRCTRSPTRGCWSRRCRARGWSTPTRSSSGASAPGAWTTSSAPSSTRSGRARRRSASGPGPGVVSGGGSGGPDPMASRKEEKERLRQRGWRRRSARRGSAPRLILGYGVAGVLAIAGRRRDRRRGQLRRRRGHASGSGRTPHQVHAARPTASGRRPRGHTAAAGEDHAISKRRPRRPAAS